MGVLPKYIRTNATNIDDVAKADGQIILDMANSILYFDLPDDRRIAIAGKTLFTDEAKGDGLNPVYLNSSGEIVASIETAGSSSQPVYMLNGEITNCNFTVGKSVPADAVFTDTTYEEMTGATEDEDGTTGLVPAPTTLDNEAFLRGDGVWAIPAKSETAESLTTKNIGSGSKPVYINENGIPEASTESVGSNTQPVYLSSGEITPCMFSLGKSVPADAVFTDTTYETASTKVCTKRLKAHAVFTETKTSISLADYDIDIADKTADDYSVDVYMNGIRLTEGLDYSVSNGSIICLDGEGFVYDEGFIYDITTEPKGNRFEFDVMIFETITYRV